MENNDVSSNETVVTEISQDSDVSANEVLNESDSSVEYESTTVVSENDYSADLAILESLCFLQIAVMIAVGCMIAWTGAHRG